MPGSKAIAIVWDDKLCGVNTGPWPLVTREGQAFSTWVVPRIPVSSCTMQLHYISSLQEGQSAFSMLKKKTLNTDLQTFKAEVHFLGLQVNI